jgi:hypothetical protein
MLITLQLDFRNTERKQQKSKKNFFIRLFGPYKHISIFAGHNGRAGMAAIVVESEESFSLDELYDTLYSNLPKYAIPLFLRWYRVCWRLFKNSYSKHISHFVKSLTEINYGEAS